ncbi:MAG: peptidoglycan-binding protein [Pseudomonadota bacterium]
MRAFLPLFLLLANFAAFASTFGEGLAAYQRGDYAAARTVIEPLANSGDAQAQYLFGRMYARGDGVLQDFVAAHKWLNLAAARGHRDARSERDRVAGRMTSSQIAEAQRSARAFRPASAPKSTTAQATTAPAAKRYNTGNVVRDVQRMLAELGYDPGPADGLMGRRTRSAIRTYQLHSDLPVTGQANSRLREQLAIDLGYATPSDDPVAAATVSPGPAPVPAPAPAPATPDRNPIYSGGGTTTGTRTQTRQSSAGVAELREIVARARRDRSADRGVLRALEELVDQYDWPWKRVLVEDRFRDGNYTRRPAWRTVAGQFWVDGREGLRTQVAISDGKNQQQGQADIGRALIGALLGQGQRAGGPAAIALAQAIPKSFAIEMELLSGTRSGGQIEFGVYRGQNADRGLRLIYRPGAARTLELVRANAGRYVQLAGHEQPLALADGRSHAILWTRGDDGRMTVQVDGKQLLQTGPVNRKGGARFDGFFLTNRGGNYGLRSLRVLAE